MGNKVTEQLKKAQTKEHSTYFWGRLIALASLLQGAHILFYEGMLTERLDAYFLGINEDIFGMLLVAFSAVKLIGIFIDNLNMRSIGIVGLSIIWGMLTVVAVLFSFGIGYPSPVYISNLFILIACLRISYKGASR